MCLRPGLCPKPRWGLQLSPMPIVGWGGKHTSHYPSLDALGVSVLCVFNGSTLGHF